MAVADHAVPEIVIIALAGSIRRRIGVRMLMFAGLAAGGEVRVMQRGDNAAVLHGVMLIHSVYVVGSLVAMPLYVNI